MIIKGVKVEALRSNINPFLIDTQYFTIPYLCKKRTENYFKFYQDMEMNRNAVVLIPQEQIGEMLEKLTRIENLILGDAKKEAGEEWLKSEDARKLLGVSAKTWRDARKIPFTQFGRSIWVKRSAIEDFLQSNNVGRV